MLIDRLPEGVDAGGAWLPVRTDFRYGMLLEELLWDRDVTEALRAALALRLMLAGDLPEGVPVAAAYRAVLWFFACGQEVSGGGQGAVRRYDYEMDAGVLVAAFRAQYGVDLCRERMHWWVFRGMFEGLLPEHAVCRRMAVREMRLSDVEGGEARARLAQMKARYRLDGGSVEDALGGGLFGM